MFSLLCSFKSQVLSELSFKQVRSHRATWQWVAIDKRPYFSICSVKIEVIIGDFSTVKFTQVTGELFFFFFCQKLANLDKRVDLGKIS